VGPVRRCQSCSKQVSPTLRRLARPGSDAFRPMSILAPKPPRILRVSPGSRCSGSRVPVRQAW
jgi:hypothetical protein